MRRDSIKHLGLPQGIGAAEPEHFELQLPSNFLRRTKRGDRARRLLAWHLEMLRDIRPFPLFPTSDF
jgi:hypothetical protein